MVTFHGRRLEQGTLRTYLLYSIPLFTTLRIKLHFKDSKGNLIKTVEANEGDDVLSIAHEHDIDLEGTLGFANGSELRCSRWTIPFRCLRRICRMLDLSHNPRSRVIRSSAGTRGKPAIRSLFAC